MKMVKCAFILAVVMGGVVNCGAVEKPTVTAKTDTEVIAEGNNRFALELYAKLRSDEGNLFFSPYSISTALAMTYGGARSETKRQMAEVLCFPAVFNDIDCDPNKELAKPTKQVRSQQQFHSALGVIIKDLNARGAKGRYELTVANALWGQKGYGFLKEFIELIKTCYGGELNEVDFIQSAEAARQTINGWVEEQTKGKIKNLIGPGVLNEMTRLVLTNAIYFKGNWARQFEKGETKDAAFTLISGKKIDVPMMNETADFNYTETEVCQILELPYVDDELSMIIFLPKKSDELIGFEQMLTQENLSPWLAGLRKRKVIVSIPKFKLTSEFSLADVLKSMGMTDAFSSTADFSGMNGKKDLFISAVIHKAYIDVNEEGTEAAAATGVAVSLTSVEPERIPVFRADRPFLFLIRDNHSGSILFIGRVMNPKT